MNDPSILHFKVQLAPKVDASFASWHANLHEALASAEGFVSLEIVALSRLENQWRITLRFNTGEKCHLWQGSESYLSLMKFLEPLLAIGTHIQPEVGTSDLKVPLDLKVTEVFVTELQPGKEKEFRAWSAKIHGKEAQFPGFCGVYVQAPSRATEGAKHWITFLQFDSQENLERWLNSPERQEILQQSSLFASFENHRVISSYPGWFHPFSSSANQVPPLWKQGMLVLLVLFPIVMLEFKFLAPLTAPLNASLGMFVGNIISVGFVTWPLMPLAIWCMRWWLNSWKSKTPHWITLGGCCLLMLLYALEVWAFW